MCPSSKRASRQRWLEARRHLRPAPGVGRLQHRTPTSLGKRRARPPRDGHGCRRAGAAFFAAHLSQQGELFRRQRCGRRRLWLQLTRHVSSARSSARHCLCRALPQRRTSRAAGWWLSNGWVIKTGSLGSSVSACTHLRCWCACPWACAGALEAASPLIAFLARRHADTAPFPAHQN